MLAILQPAMANLPAPVILDLRHPTTSHVFLKKEALVRKDFQILQYLHYSSLYLVPYLLYFM